MDNVNRYATLSDQEFQEVHDACEAFEQALRNDEMVCIEECLAAVSEEIRCPVFSELLAIELERQRPHNMPAKIADYLVRFPDRQGDVERVFQEVSRVATAGELPQKTTAAQPQHDPVRVSIPGYEVEEVLGRGGMGVVYKARHLKLKRTVALKVLLVGVHADPRELERFRIEGEAVARLAHPNIVQIHEVGEAGGHPYCALEFVEGENLARLLENKPMPAREAAKLVETLARAMQLAHSRNVVHRDLKPANIMLAADGTPKITDFGLARQLDIDSGQTLAGAVLGTPSYMAPEQASGQAHEAGPAADVYSLGAILYDCLTGRPPFKGDTPVETLDQVRTCAPSAPSRWLASIPLDLDTICLKCLRKELENRYASAAELADELVRYQRGEPILASPVGRMERVVKWLRRNPVEAATRSGLAGIILTALILVSWSYWRAENALDVQLSNAPGRLEQYVAEHEGIYRKMSDGKWEVEGATGKGTPIFREISRDKDWITLLDDGRMQYAHLPVRGGVSQYSVDQGKTWWDGAIVRLMISEIYVSSKNGTYRNMGDGKWAVEGATGNGTAIFREISRDKDWITLLDDRRMRYGRIPVRGGMAQYSVDGGKTWFNSQNVRLGELSNDDAHLNFQGAAQINRSTTWKEEVIRGRSMGFLFQVAWLAMLLGEALAIA